MKREADVLIVGAGTSGTYLAWRLAEAGYRCLVLEREALDELGTSIGPFHMEEASFKRFGIPLPEGGELEISCRLVVDAGAQPRIRGKVRSGFRDEIAPGVAQGHRGGQAAPGVYRVHREDGDDCWRHQEALRELPRAPG